MNFHDGMTLAEAKEELRKLVDEGHKCPCCTQLAKVYRRTIHSTMAHSLVVMWQNAGQDWQHIPSLLHRKAAADVPKLRHWGLLEEEKALRPDGGRTGVWRITDMGADFVLGRLEVPKYAHVYDNRTLKLSGASVGIGRCLGAKFDYAALMAGPVAA